MNPVIRRHMTSCIVSGMLCLAGACDDGSSDGQDDQSGTSYTKVVASESSSLAPLPFCSLVRHPMFGPAGLYRVDGLTGVREEDLWNPGSENGFTYVELTRITAWRDAEETTVTARIMGGPDGAGSPSGYDVSLSVDEVVGLLLVEAVPENRGRYGLHVLGTFHRQDNGGYSNGHLFVEEKVDEQEMKDLIEAISATDAGAPCPAPASDDDAGSP